MSAGNAEATSDAQKRTRLGGYEILAKLGQGGMGAVFKARQVSIDRVVALKILPPRLAKNRDYVERFFREARSAAKLNHPNIVQAIDAGEADGYYYFAMEFVPGESIAALLRGGKPMPEKRALEIARDIAKALNYAHEAGIVHRDIKPANILLAADGTAKLADLGLARETTDKPTDLTQAGYAIGTPDYISPEQVRGEATIDGRSDLYSLGATLYHMLVGAPPYAGGTGNEVMAKHLADPIPNVHKANPQVSYAAGRIIWRAMAKDRDKRYKTGAEFMADIDRVLAAPAPGVPPGGTRTAPVARKTSTSRRPAYAALAILVLAGAAVLIVVHPWKPGTVTNGGNGPTTEPPKVDNAAADRKLLRDLRDTVRRRPTDFQANIRDYSAALPRFKDAALAQQAQNDLDGLKAGRQRAADAAFAQLEGQAAQLAKAGDYDGAAAVYGKTPAEFADLLADRARDAAAGVRAAAEKRIEDVIGQAEQFSKDGEPGKGRAALAELRDVKYAALRPKIDTLDKRLETEEKDGAANLLKQEQAAARKVIEKLVEDIEAAALKGDLAGAGRLADDASKDPKLKVVESELKPVAGVGAALGRAAASANANLADIIRALIGKEETFKTTQGPVNGIIKDVTADTVVVEKTFTMGGEKVTRTYRVAIADLLPETRDRLRPKWTPQTADEWIAAALIALKDRNPADMEKALENAEEHPLHARYAAKLDELKVGAAEDAAAKAWDKLAPYQNQTAWTAPQRETARKGLDDFELKYGKTNLATTVAARIADIRRRIRESEPPVAFTAQLPLIVSTYSWGKGQFSSHEIGRTPAPADKPIPIPRDTLWTVAPINKADFTTRDLAELAKVAAEKQIPGIDLEGCRKITDADVRGLVSVVPHLAILVLNETAVTDRSLAEIAKLRELVVLGASKTTIGNDGIAQLRRLPDIRVLGFAETRVTDGAVQYLKAMKSLELLGLSKGELSDGGVRELQTALPKLIVLRN